MYLHTGKYLLFRADRAFLEQKYGATVRLTSPTLGHLGGPFCLTFAYHMKGINMGEIYVETVGTRGTDRPWSRRGPQGGRQYLYMWVGGGGEWVGCR
jgi:hypothetical protein